jgi:hypothetical protein
MRTLGLIDVNIINGKRNKYRTGATTVRKEFYRGASLFPNNLFYVRKSVYLQTFQVRKSVVIYSYKLGKNV